MPTNKFELLKTSLFYLLKIELVLFFHPYVCAPLSLAVLLFLPQIQDTVYTNLANGICGGIIELVLLFIIFFPEFYNNKKSELKSLSLSFGAALILQFVIARINYFYPYTAGMSVTCISQFLYTKFTGNMPHTPNSLPAYYYIIITLITDIFRIATVFTAFAIAKHRQSKETKEILGTKPNGT